MFYLQGRVVAVDPEEAADKIKASFPGMEFSRLKIRPCPVQPYPGLTWWEWLGKMREKSLNSGKTVSCA